MSYCRWSSMDFRCDLYCYEDASGGWTTHVAGRRIVGEVVPAPDLYVANWNELPEERRQALAADWAAQYKAHLDSVGAAKRVDIDLPHAGETFNDPTLQAFKQRLLDLRALGYVFPDGVLSEIDAEIAEGAAQ